MKIIIGLISLLIFTSTYFAKGTLSDNLRIESEQLGYALQYRVYIPDGVKKDEKLPTIYITDGQWYLGQGNMAKVLDHEIAEGNINPVIAIFVDNRNPDDLSQNRRNQQFMCNKKYAAFYVKELVPTINNNYPVSSNRDNRVIAGISFGGLNAGCFGIMAYNTFSGIGMQSPASGAHLKLLSKLYKDNDKLPLKIFMSIGTKKDNTRAGRKYHRVLKNKGYDINYIEVPFGHEWRNWKPLMDDMLLTFFKKSVDS